MHAVLYHLNKSYKTSWWTPIRSYLFSFTLLTLNTCIKCNLSFAHRLWVKGIHLTPILRNYCNNAISIPIPLIVTVNIQGSSIERQWDYQKYLGNVTHCGLVTPYGGRDLGQNRLWWWLGAWRLQDITWINIDLSSLTSSDVVKLAWKLFIWKRFYWHFPGANELTAPNSTKGNSACLRLGG